MGAKIALGVDRLVNDLQLVGGKRWGLVTNYTAVTSSLRLSSVALKEAGAPLVALFSPEHGLRGTAQAGYADSSATDPQTGLPVVDTYRMEPDVLRAAFQEHQIDALLVDIQDVGLRFYTYVWTMLDCMKTAAKAGIPTVILDRPNPLSGLIEGPGLLQQFSSFVGRIDIPLRHGLTIGELAKVSYQMQNLDPALSPQVIEMRGWTRQMWWQDTDLTWIMPSPNIPTPESALAYAGTALFEGTNMSEGRGTTRPFELIGAPWLDEAYARALNDLELPGVQFRSAWFKPTISKHAGEVCGGCQLHIVDRQTFDPIKTAIYMLNQAMHAKNSQFQWREPAWEGDQQRPSFIDLLWGSSSLREGLDEGNLQACLALVDTDLGEVQRLERNHLYQ